MLIPPLSILRPGWRSVPQVGCRPMQRLVVELWVDDHQEYEPGVIHAHLRHARVPLDPRPGDDLIVGDDEVEPALAEVLTRDESGGLRFADPAGACIESS